MSPPESVTYRIEEGDYLAFNALVFRRTWIRCLLLGIPGAALIAVPVAWIERSFVQGVGLIMVGLAAGAIYSFVLRLFLGPRVRKVYRETASLQEELTLVLAESGLLVEQPSGSHRVEWGQLVRWDENDTVFAVFTNRVQALIFPKQQVGREAIDFMREQMLRSGLNRPWKLRK